MSLLTLLWLVTDDDSLLIQRIDKARRRAEQKLALYAQAELRETRTRRQTKKPDYVYAPEYESDVSVLLRLYPGSSDVLDVY